MTKKAKNEDGASTWRLNKYLAHGGIASRRACNELIQEGLVKVNGEVVTEPGFRLDPATDEVRFKGEVVRPEKKVYILMNKPKGVITTTQDERDRKTVMDLLRKPLKEHGVRLYPVGRLDRDTTGLLMITNDGTLAKHLTHPSTEVSKVYRVVLHKALRPDDFDAMKRGFTLEDGPVQFDEIAFPDPTDHRVVGVSLHMGRNRIVRRCFAHFGYEVTKLDRVLFAGLTKKDLPRGRWRYLTDEELRMLRHFTGKNARKKPRRKRSE